MNNNNISPIFELYKKNATYNLMNYFVDKEIDEYHRKKEIENGSEISGESVRKNLGSGDNLGILEKYGVVERNKWDVNMPRFRLADSDAVYFIQQYDIQIFHPLFRNKTRRDIFFFFIQQADSNKKYTRSKLKTILGINWEAIDETVSRMEKIGMLEAHDNGNSVDYSYVPDSVAEHSANRFNNILLQEYRNKTDGVEVDVFGVEFVI